MKVITIGNCQAQRIGKYIQELLPGVEVTFLSASSKVQDMFTESEAEELVKNCELIIRQPLSNNYGILGSEATKAMAGSNVQIINFAYFFNSGFSSLCHAPAAPKLYGEEIVKDLFSGGYNLYSILKLWSSCSIDFKVEKRFHDCLNEFRNREVNCDIKVSDFIASNHTRIRLFDTHNHPTKEMFLFYLEVLRSLDILPRSLNLNSLSETGMPLPACPITPRDKEEHGYEFDYDPDWDEKGRYLIENVILKEYQEIFTNK